MLYQLNFLNRRSMEASNPLVSIILPVHNGEKYLRESLDSCVNQTYKNIEIIIVDDESTDNTPTILKEYAKNDCRINIIRTKKQKALGNVINVGIRKSSGKYIARMDSDDIMYLDRIEKQTKYLESNDKCVVVGGQIDIIDENSKITGSREYPLDDGELRKNLFLFQPFAHPAVMIRKLPLEEIGLYPENLPKVEDVKLFFMLSTKGEFHNLSDKVLKYRITFNTESQTKMVEHFKKTSEIRVWAIKNLNIKPTFREKLIWGIEYIGVIIMSIFPSRIFMKTFEYARHFLK